MYSLHNDGASYQGIDRSARRIALRSRREAREAEQIRYALEQQRGAEPQRSAPQGRPAQQSSRRLAEWGPR